MISSQSSSLSYRTFPTKVLMGQYRSTIFKYLVPLTLEQLPSHGWCLAPCGLLPQHFISPPGIWCGISSQCSFAEAQASSCTHGLMGVGLKFVGQLRGGLNQLLPCLNNYAYFKLFTQKLMKVTIMHGIKQKNIIISHTYEIHKDKYFLRKPIQGKNLFFFIW